MVYQGKVLHGVIVLEEGVVLPDGTAVRVEALEASTTRPAAGSLAERLLRLAGTVEGLPPDFARNHDHYLHGQPKR